jgi:hypothetical protein
VYWHALYLTQPINNSAFHVSCMQLSHGYHHLRPKQQQRQ